MFLKYVLCNYPRDTTPIKEIEGHKQPAMRWCHCQYFLNSGNKQTYYEHPAHENQMCPFALHRKASPE